MKTSNSCFEPADAEVSITGNGKNGDLAYERERADLWERLKRPSAPRRGKVGQN